MHEKQQGASFRRRLYEVGKILKSYCEDRYHYEEGTCQTWLYAPEQHDSCGECALNGLGEKLIEESGIKEGNK